jgi:hypothetical protein
LAEARPAALAGRGVDQHGDAARHAAERTGG